jgi:hypothetical protein
MPFNANNPPPLTAVTVRRFSVFHRSRPPCTAMALSSRSFIVSSVKRSQASSFSGRSSRAYECRPPSTRCCATWSGHASRRRRTSCAHATGCRGCCSGAASGRNQGMDGALSDLAEDAAAGAGGAGGDASGLHRRVLAEMSFPSRWWLASPGRDRRGEGHRVPATGALEGEEVDYRQGCCSRILCRAISA